MPVHQTFAFAAFHRCFGAGGVIEAKGNAVIPAERQLIDVTLQMVLANRVLRTHDLALHEGMKALWRYSRERNRQGARIRRRYD